MICSTPAVFLIVTGVLAVIGAALNWRIVSHSGKLLNRFLGDKAARAIYSAIGVLLIVLGVMQMFEI